jgi:hypothetical protein
VRVASIVLLLATSGCLSTLGDLGAPGPGQECLDAGDGGVCGDGAADLDAGIELNEDPAALRDDACPLLVARVCGAAEDGCADEPACIAAHVLDEADDVERCAAAYDDTARWPDCVPGPCAVLVDRVCGGSTAPGRCEDAPGCAPARELLDSAASDDAEDRQSAEVSCNAALEDDVVFATCAS